MTAFIPAAAPSAFTARRTLTTCEATRRPASSTTRMATASWPDDDAAPYSKYLSNIPFDRVNRAPVIVINKFNDPMCNSVSVSCPELPADGAAGESIKAGVYVDDSPAPSPALWGAYYDPATVHSAPIISMVGGADMAADVQYVCVVNTTVPTSIAAGAALLNPGEPDPSLFASRYGDRLNKAPYLQLDADAGEKGHVSIEQAGVGLNIFAAQEILSKYQS